jgi:hypothetical protein
MFGVLSRLSFHNGEALAVVAVVFLYTAVCLVTGYVIGRRVRSTSASSSNDCVHETSVVYIRLRTDDSTASSTIGEDEIEDEFGFGEGSDYKIEFGMYRGWKLRDIPTSYLGWLKKSGVLKKYDLLSYNYNLMVKEVSSHGRYAEYESVNSIPPVRLAALKRNIV